MIRIKPRNLFLLDSIGAVVSAFFLFVVLKTFEPYFGMPGDVLNYLSAIAVMFCIYSTSCFFFVMNNWRPFLAAISTANLLYCFATLILVGYYYNSITAPGMIYFIGEIAIVCGVVFLEFKTIRRKD